VEKSRATNDLPDLWADPGTAGLPAALVLAHADGDWNAVRDQILSGVAPRALFGRQAMQLRRTIPIGIDPVLDQHRGLAAVAYGEWDVLERVLRSRPVDADELTSHRDALLAPIAVRDEAHGAAHGLVGGREYEYICALNAGRHRRLIRAMLSWRPALAERPDVPAQAFLRFRRLQETALAALAEAVAGTLDAAIALALEAEGLGSEEGLHVLAADVEHLARHARGGVSDEPVAFLDHLRSARGHPPFSAASFLLDVFPLMAARHDADLARATALLENIAQRLSSPRLQFAAHCWRVFAAHLTGERSIAREVPALVAEGRWARPGLAGFAAFIDGLVSGRAERIADAERLARRSGQVWMQVSAVVQLMAARPDERTARRAARLLRISGWRRIAGLTPDTATVAIESMVASGLRGEWLVELAVATARPSTAARIALATATDHAVPDAERVAALIALEGLGVDTLREQLRPLAREGGAVGRAAASYLERPRHPAGLTTRELEVLELAGVGLTNKAIADRLGLSWHTIARHLANARSKLGATNRSAAAVQLEQLRADRPRVVKRD
jgi:DNA-binding NarL/FixJ family response regulator